MASHEAYLRNALSQYQHKDITKREILNAFQSFTDLRPTLDTFVFNDGARSELLCLDGTVPVTYKGNTYNIPVCLWLTKTHPYNPPMAFVKPTASMQIKPGRHVDTNGKVYLPYLHEWRHPQSDLLGLIQILVIVFGEDPPVFARSSAGPPPARPPYLAGGAPGGTNPPYPAQGGGMPTPYPPSAAAPGYPAQGAYAPTAGGYPGYQAPTAGYQQPPPYPAQTTAPAAGQAPGQAPSQGPYAPGQAPYSAYSTNPTYAQPAGATATSTSTAATVSDEHIRASLLSAVEDKMKRRLREIFAQAQAEMDALKKTQEDLQKGKTSLDDMLSNLEREQNQVEQNITLLKEKDEEIQEVLGKMENREEVDIDDAVVPTAPLYKQLMNSFAEEQATEDAIYYLGEALRKEVVDLDVFLKQVRELSKRQFMLRVLIHKCRETAGLAEIRS